MWSDYLLFQNFSTNIKNTVPVWAVQDMQNVIPSEYDLIRTKNIWIKN